MGYWVIGLSGSGNDGVVRMVGGELIFVLRMLVCVVSVLRFV